MALGQNDNALVIAPAHQGRRLRVFGVRWMGIEHLAVGDADEVSAELFGFGFDEGGG